MCSLRLLNKQSYHHTQFQALRKRSEGREEILPAYPGVVNGPLRD